MSRSSAITGSAINPRHPGGGFSGGVCPRISLFDSLILATYAQEGP